MLEYKHDRNVFVKEVERCFELYGFKDIKASDVYVFVDSDYLSLSYSVGDSVFSVSYTDDDSVRQFTSSFKHHSLCFTFERNYDIDELEDKEENVYSYIFNYEGYYGNKLVSELVKEGSKDLSEYKTFSQCLSDILLSVLGYTDK